MNIYNVCRNDEYSRCQCIRVLDVHAVQKLSMICSIIDCSRSGHSGMRHTAEQCVAANHESSGRPLGMVHPSNLAKKESDGRDPQEWCSTDESAKIARLLDIAQVFHLGKIFFLGGSLFIIGVLHQLLHVEDYRPVRIDIPCSSSIGHFLTRFLPQKLSSRHQYCSFLLWRFWIYVAFPKF